MKWKEVSVGDVTDHLKGFAFKSSQYVLHGVPVVRVSDFTEDSISTQETKFYPMNLKDDYLKYVLEAGDVLIQTVGSWQNNPLSVVGKVVSVPEELKGALLNQNIVKLLPSEEIDAHFLFYRLKCNDFYGHNIGNATGAANQASITLNTINSFKFLIPPPPTQRRIAEILFAYDDLIENNQKQIKLLEEAAMLLYKKWFVKLRFPGHENTKIVDGIPAGWRNCHLSEVALVNATTIPRNYPHLNINYVDIGSVRAGNIDIRTEYTLANAPGRAKRIAMDGDIIWGMVRPNLKAYALVLEPMPNDIFSTGFAVITAGSVPFPFLYCVVIQDAFVSYLVNCTNGAAYPAVKPIHFEDAKIIVPTDDLLTAFNEKTEPMYRRAHILRQQIDQAKIARDKLLPKLMNGEIEVL